MALLVLAGFSASARAASMDCPNDRAGLAAIFVQLQGVTELTDIEVTDEAACLGTGRIEAVNVNATVTCGTGGACVMPPIRAFGGGQLTLRGFTFDTVAAFVLAADDDNRDLFPGYDAVTASLYSDGVDLELLDVAFEAPEPSFGGVVFLDGALTLTSVDFREPSGHALKVYADDADVVATLTGVSVAGAGDSAALVSDDFGDENVGVVTSFSMTESSFAGDEAARGADIRATTEGDLSLTSTTFADSVASGVGAPVELLGETVSLTDVTVARTQGTTASALFLVARDTVSMTRVNVEQPGEAALAVEAYAIEAVNITDSTFDLVAPLGLDGGHAELEGNFFYLPGGNPAQSGLRVATASLDFTRNRFCGGPIALPDGLVWAPATDLFFEQNLFQGLELDGPLVGTATQEGSSTPRSVAFLDNTFVDVVATAIFAGRAEPFTFVNNLVDDGPIPFDFADSPATPLVNFNLWYPDAVELAEGWGADDVLADPLLVLDYDPERCASLPELTVPSPAVDSGSDKRFSPDGTRSDIGAIDLGAEADWGDTGDAADTGRADDPDTDGDGWTDADDCQPADSEVHPNATDMPGDGVDQDCDGEDASVGYRGGCGSGCGTNPGAVPAALALPLFLLLHRRRLPR